MKRVSRDNLLIALAGLGLVATLPLIVHGREPKPEAGKAASRKPRAESQATDGTARLFARAATPGARRLAVGASPWPPRRTRVGQASRLSPSVAAYRGAGSVRTEFTDQRRAATQ